MKIVSIIFCLLIGLKALSQSPQIDFVDQLRPVADAQIDGSFGSSIDTDGQYLVIGAPGTSLVGVQSGAVYIYKLETTWNLVATLTSPNPSSPGHFGSAVAIEGDFIVVGANRENILYYNSGVAYVYTKPTGEWQNSNSGIALLPSDSTINEFGHSVAISGDYIVVGGRSGKAAFLYKKSSSGWTEGTELAKLMPSDPTDLNYPEAFGYSVDIKGDLVLIGSPYHDLTSLDEGAAYIFEKPVTGWQTMTETAKLTSISSDNNNNFGNAVSVGSDYVAVGALREDGGGIGIGAAYIFEKPAGGWKDTTESAKLTPSDGVLQSDFGIDVLAHNDFLFVGSNYKRTNGAVYVFSKTNGEWITSTEKHKILPMNTLPRSTFGYSIGVLGNEIMLGNSELSGHVEIFETTNASWTDVSYKNTLASSFVTSSRDEFGISVAIDNNIAVVGASGDDLDNEGTGAAYVFELRNNQWVKLAKLTASNSERYAKAGFSVAIKNDLILIGAPNKDDPDNNLYDVGVVYAFSKPSSGWSDMNETQIIKSKNPRNRGSFGASVAIGPDYIVVGEDDLGCVRCSSRIYLFQKDQNNNIVPGGILLDEEADIGFELAVYNDVIVSAFQNAYGKIKVIEKGDNGWDNAFVTTIIGPAGLNTSSWFGSSVAIYDSVIAIGAPKYIDDEANFADRVYLYRRKTGAWKDGDYDTLSYDNPDPAKYSNFGLEVSLSEKYLLIGGTIGDALTDKAQVWRVRKEQGAWNAKLPLVKLSKTSTFNGFFYDRGTPIAIENEEVLVGSFNGDLSANDNSGLVLAYDFTAPVISFEGPETTAENLLSITMYCSEPVLAFSDTVFNTISSRITNITKVNDLEYLLDLEVIEEDSFSISLPSNLVFDLDGNPNYQAEYRSFFDPVLGIDGRLVENYSIYPNPAKDILHIKFNHIKRRHISLRDAFGGEKFREVTEEQNLLLDMKRFAAGLYFVIITEDGRSSSIKIIVNK